MKYVITKHNDFSYTVRFEDCNAIQESLSLELTLRYDNSAKNSLVKTWFQKGYIEKAFETYWGLETYVKDSEGHTYGAYNPQIKKDEKSTRNVINFDWMLEGTEKHFYALIQEAYNRFMSATGKSATEIRLEKIYAFAEKESLEVVTAMPENWIKIESAIAPKGCVMVYDQMPTLKLRREKGLHKKLLIL